MLSQFHCTSYSMLDLTRLTHHDALQYSMSNKTCPWQTHLGANTADSATAGLFKAKPTPQLHVADQHPEPSTLASTSRLLSSLSPHALPATTITLLYAVPSLYYHCVRAVLLYAVPPLYISQCAPACPAWTCLLTQSPSEC